MRETGKSDNPMLHDIWLAQKINTLKAGAIDAWDVQYLSDDWAYLLDEYHTYTLETRTPSESQQAKSIFDAYLAERHAKHPTFQKYRH